MTLEVAILRFHLLRQQVVAEDNKIEQADLLTQAEAVEAVQDTKAVAVAVQVVAVAEHLLQAPIQIQIHPELLARQDKATAVATDITAGRVVVEQGVQD
jgi:hypothetical protein